MTSWLGQYCINVTDLDASVAFYGALGLANTSRTEIPQAFEAIVEHPGGGSKLQLAQQKEPADPFDIGTGFWKLYVNTHDVRRRTPAPSPPAPRWSRRPSGWSAGPSPWPSSGTATATSSSSSSATPGPTTRPPAPRGSASTASTSPTSRRRSGSTSCSGSRAPAAPRSPTLTRRSSSSPAAAGSCSSPSRSTRTGRSAWARCGSST